MTVRVLLFATYAELLGESALDIDVRGPATVSDILGELRRRHAGASRLPARPLVALNQVHAGLDSAVADGDELALLPPMAGG